ncbi:MAG: nuclear transport factor 2 family protein [Chloroflexi bacterium]|nr:nuclear transport factor 2 family protein [Chloroflexota bacterium]
MKADSKTETEVKAVLNQLAESYATRDMNRLLAVCAPDPDHVMYGTGADEKRIGLAEIKAQAERDWAQTDSSTIAYSWTSVSSAGQVAWAAADAAFSFKADGQEMSLPARLTAVFEKRGDKWLIVQSHFSFPATGQTEGVSFPAE